MTPQEIALRDDVGNKLIAFEAALLAAKTYSDAQPSTNPAKAQYGKVINNSYNQIVSMHQLLQVVDGSGPGAYGGGGNKN